MSDINFGSYSIIGTTKVYLEEEPEWFWEFQPITSEMELQMSKFMASHRNTLEEDGSRGPGPTWMEIAFEELSLSFASTNIPKGEVPVSDGGEPILEAGASPAEVRKVVGKMPRPLLMELWRGLGKTYPFWGPSDPNAL